MKRAVGIIASLLWAVGAIAWAMLPYAQGGEARQGGDDEVGSVHEHPVGNADAPKGEQ